jgi:hypothetical protein
MLFQVMIFLSNGGHECAGKQTFANSKLTQNMKISIKHHDPAHLSACRFSTFIRSKTDHRT